MRTLPLQVIARDEAIFSNKTDCFIRRLVRNDNQQVIARDEAISISKTDCFAPFHFARNDNQQVIARDEAISISKTDCFAPFHFARNDIRILMIIIFMLFSFPMLAQNAEPKLHGYIQTRFTTNFENTNDFMIRRAKLWVDGNVPGLENVTYKIQTVYRSFKDESVMLQDAFADIKINEFGSVRAGRFIPDFTLQRMQPDYEISDLERAGVISGLIHSTKSMGRQIGAQMTYQPNYFPMHISVGVFNANLESPGKNKDLNLLYTSHTQLTLVKKEDELLEVGFSAAYRYANSISMNTIYNADQLIAGDDFRFGFEYQLQYKDFGLQSEFIEAHINNDKAWGYYASMDYSFNEKFQATAGVEKYADLIKATNDNEWYGVGLIYYFTERTKLMTDFKTQYSSNKNNYLTEIQYQIFFN